MNELHIYSLRDIKADYFLPPFTMRNDAEAIRAFGDSVSKKGNTLGDHPEDFQLCKLAVVNLDTGAVTPLQVTALCLGSDFNAKEV